MRFIKSSFFIGLLCAVVAMGYPEYARGARETCYAGTYNYDKVSGCTECPINCYCNGNVGDEGDLWSGYEIEKCSPGAEEEIIRKIGSDEKSPFAGVYSCPSQYPNSAAGAKWKSQCYYHNTSGCLSCSSGQYLKGRDCTKCEPGYGCTGHTICGSGGQGVYYSDGVYSRQECDPGYCSSINGSTCSGSSTGSTQCMRCPTGTFAGTSKSSSCTSAPAGKCAANNSGNCTTSAATQAKSCPAGTCSSIDNKKCAGRGNSGAAFCIQCPAYETSSEGSAECTRCASGSFPVKVNEGVFCGLCKDKTPDTYYSADERNCVACKKANQYIDGNECKKCPDFNTDLGWSYFVNDDNSVNNNGIKSCSVKVTTNTGCTIIYNYNGTKYVADANAKETSAPKNQYIVVDKNGMGSCQDCPDDKASSDGGSGGIEKCYKCGAGYCTTGGDEKTICHKCSAGYSCPLNDNGKVQMCGGDFNDKFGVNKCPINTYSLAGASQCIACAGNYTTNYTTDTNSQQYCDSDHQACGSPLACVIKKTNLCHYAIFKLLSPLGNETYTLNKRRKICEPWPNNIIEGKIDRSVIKEIPQ